MLNKLLATMALFSTVAFGQQENSGYRLKSTPFSQTFIANAVDATSAQTLIGGPFSGGSTNGIQQLNGHGTNTTLVDAIATSSFQLPNAAAPTTDAFGEIAGDNNAWAAGRGAIQFFDGTANVFVVGALASDVPTNGQVPTWNTGGTITWETPPGSGTVTATAGALTANAVVLGAGSTDTKVSASITTDGSAKVTLGTLDVGNTTDTTVSRSAAGIIAVEGVAVPTVSSTDTLANKTLTTPTIASLANANHTHQDSAGGGTLNAAAIAAGTVATARLGSGTANSSSFLRGDQTWAVPSGASDNWTASGTTNSTLVGNAALNALTATNGITAGSGTSAGVFTLGDADNSNFLSFTTPSAITTNINIIGAAAPYSGGLAIYTVSAVTNLTINYTNALAGLNTALGSTLFNDTRTLTIAGTANEITSSAGAQDLSANRTWTLSLPSALTFTGKTITGGSYSSPTITTPTISGAIVFPDGVRQTFNPDGTTPGLSVGSQAGDPSTPANGDLWYDSSGQLLRARINGATVSLGSGGTTVNSTGGPLYVATADGTVANTTTETTLFGSGVGTKTLPANYLTAGKTIQVRLRGRVGTKTVSPGTLTIKLKVGSTVVWSAALSYPASLANDYAEFLGHFTCRTTGASGTVFAQAMAFYNDGVTTTVNAPISANTTTSTIDTTATQVVDVTATWATADPANTITASIATIDDGSGGSVTATGGSLTSNAVVLGAGSTDTKVVAGIITDGTSKVTLGVAGTSVGSVDLKNATSGTLTLKPTTGALGTVSTTFPASDTLVPISAQQLTFSGPTAARTITLPDAAITVARTDAGQTFTGTQNITTIDVGNTDTTITRSAAGVIAVEGVDVVNTTTTQTLQNKTITTTSDGGNNTLKRLEYVYFIFPDRASGTSATIATSDATAKDFGIVTFTGNTAVTNNNFCVFSWVVPDDIDTSVDLKVSRIQIETRGTTTTAHTYNVGMLDIADSAASDETDATTFINYKSISTGTLSSPASGDIFTVSAQTLTSWRTSVTAGHRLKISVVRNDTNADSSRLRMLAISYGSTQ